MLIQYGIPILMTLLLALIVWQFKTGLRMPGNAYVEIIVGSGDKSEDLESTVMLTKQLTKRYFTNASVYVRSADEAYVNALCRRYHVHKREPERGV